MSAITSYLRKRVQALATPSGGSPVVKLFPSEVLQIADRIEELESQVRRLEQPSAEVWCPVFEGKPDHGACCIGIVRGLSWLALDSAYNDICETIEAIDDTFDADVHGVAYRLTNLRHEPGQMTFPETGQWDFPPYWECDLEVLSIDRSAALTEEHP